MNEDACKININRIIENAYNKKITDENVKNIIETQVDDIYNIINDTTGKDTNVINEPINNLPSLSDNKKKEVKNAIFDFFDKNTCDGPKNIEYPNYIGNYLGKTKTTKPKREGEEERKKEEKIPGQKKAQLRVNIKIIENKIIEKKKEIDNNQNNEKLKTKLETELNELKEKNKREYKKLEKLNNPSAASTAEAAPVAEAVAPASTAEAAPVAEAEVVEGGRRTRRRKNKKRRKTNKKRKRVKKSRRNKKQKRRKSKKRSRRRRRR